MFFTTLLLLNIISIIHAQNKKQQHTSSTLEFKTNNPTTTSTQPSSTCSSSTTNRRRLTKQTTSKTTTSKLPHIILIVLDDVGYADLRTFNPTSNLGANTPNMANLWDNGVKLTRFYTQEQCSPTRGSLMTARYPMRWRGQHSVATTIHKTWVPDDEEFLPELLREQGYTTVAIGKWHLGHGALRYTPTGRGFQKFFGPYSGAGNHWQHVISGTRFVDLHDDVQQVDGSVQRSHVFGFNGTHSTTLTEQEAVKTIMKHSVASTSPLFLYLPFQAPHTPTQVHKKYVDRNQHIAGMKRREFAGMITQVDDAVGNIVQALHKKEMWDNTLLITFSDNGGQTVQGASNYPLRGTKSTPFEGGTRVPAFISGGYLPLDVRGSTFSGLIHVTDVLPTLRAAMPLHLKIRLPKKKMDGISFWSSILAGNEKISERKEMLYALDPYVRQRGETMRPYITKRDFVPDGTIIEDTGFASKHAAIRMGNYKYIEGLTGRDSWFGADPSHALQPRMWQIGAGQAGDVVQDRPDLVRLSTTKQREYRTGEITDMKLVTMVFLFNVEQDPTESHNLAKEMPMKVKEMQERLKLYKKEMVMPWDGLSSLNGNPNLLQSENGMAQWYDFVGKRKVVDFWNPKEVVMGAVPIRRRGKGKSPPASKL